MLDSLIKQKVIKHLQEREACLPGKTAVIGFDGFVDSIMRVVEKRDGFGNLSFFQTIAELGTHLISKQNMSCSIELKQQHSKLGGNAPIMANALGQMGINVSCVGALGYPVIHDAFKKMSPNCKLTGFTNPGLTTALEFNDGKVMLSQTDMETSWDNLKEIIGIDVISELFFKADLLGMVNWGEMAYTTSIWEGVIKEVLPNHSPNKKQIMFFDLSDFSKRSQEDIIHVVSLIEKFNRHYAVTLGLNENESRLMYGALFNRGYDEDLSDIGRQLKERITIDRLIIHPTRSAMAWDQDGTYQIDNEYIEKPVLSTGGGDNFNAGFCMGALLGLDTPSLLLLANYASGFYVSHGYSADIEQLTMYMSGKAL